MRITGYFGSLKNANEVVEKLKSKGFKNSFVDANDHYIGNRDVNIDLPGTSGVESLADLVLNSGADNLDKGNSPLAAASPMVSGMSSTEEITDINYCVVVDMDGGDTNFAKSIIIDMGGSLENPNVSRYETIARNDINVERPSGQGNQIYTKRE